MYYLNKTGIVRRVARKYGMTTDDTAAWFDAFIDVLGEAVVEDDINIYGFGSFKHVDRAPKIGRNLVTGEEITIPARKIIKFEPSKKLLERLNNKKKDGVPDVKAYESEN
ncbi:MAG: HU family DNA-binding protein [Bacteroidales bacterium]|nr:HU family DNA-binding protein [Bacteroidales bacterium]